MTYRENLPTAYRKIAELESRLALREAELVTLRAHASTDERSRASTDERSRSGDASPTCEGKTDETRSDPPPMGSWSKVLPAPHAWPLPLTAILAVTYLVRFGATAPSSVMDLVPIERGSMLCAIAGSAILSARYFVRRAAGRSTAKDRRLLLLAGLVATPFLIPMGIVAVSVGSTALGVLATVATVVMGIYSAIKWVATNET
jgi:hypothetical protein